ncbi:nucleotide-diphospho-sugar transferase [Corynespora cassiicola Philippines]|uniref:Nucleotide-diphospho-sugar transferase n=1 Tax=Corynespora cassiicola Philippines TaxID=1448308 RepID=A0A2T2P7N4_CORCC|nr:nucleotide-diphospho-sugar transferase [Corynespora cassiicola Philippines]
MPLKARRYFTFLTVTSVLIGLSYLLVFAPSARLASLPSKLPAWKYHPPKYAYATFLGPPTSHNATTTNSTRSLGDPYFTSTRLLTYQILHAPQTRTHLPHAPFLILVLPSTPEAWINVLQAEGATIVRIEPIDLSPTSGAFDRQWVAQSRFRDVLAKLRLWELDAWDKILYLDADSFLLHNLDGIFEDKDVGITQKTLSLGSSAADGASEEASAEDRQGEELMPEEYLMAASTDTYGSQLEWEPPSASHPEYLCACFMLVRPSRRVFGYYMHVLNRAENPLKDAVYPEQDLLIWVHRKEGRMPWKRIPIVWSANDGDMDGRVGRVRSLHVKGWEGAEGGNKFMSVTTYMLEVEY